MPVEKKYLHNIDLVNNKLLNPVVNPLTTLQRTALTGLLTIADKGYLTFDTTANSFYFWDGSAWQVFGSITSVTATTPLFSSGGSTPNITIQQSSNLQSGYLSDTDWITFNAKQDAIALTTLGTSGAATFIGNTLNIPQYQAALTNPVTGTGVQNYLTKWGATPSTLTDSLVYDNGSGVMVNTTTYNDYKFDINGSARVQTNLVVGPINAILVDTNYALRVNTPLSGAVNAFGVFSDGEVQSDVVNNTHYFRSLAKTAATPFTLSNVNHFSATQGTFGAGSTVGYQFGFRVFPSLIGATTNNFGYYGEVPLDGVKNWNAYMLGTAPNYFNGNVLIGTTTNTGGYKLNVNGTFYTSGANTLGNLSGAGTRMVVASSTGVLSTQTIPTSSGGTVTSVNLTMPSAFTVSGNPVTTSGTLAVAAAGSASQYIRGDGTLANFPSTGGGGGTLVSYYLNGGVNQGVFVGNTYYQMNKTPITGVGTNADFTIATDGYIAQFITDPLDPSKLSIPSGNWNFEMYFSVSSSGGSPSFYIELSKYDGVSFTPIANSSATPEGITNGTTIDLYTTALAIPATTLALTDRLAIRIYVNHSGRTITLHTQNGHLCQVNTTFTVGITTLNGITDQTQYFQTGTAGTDFNIDSLSTPGTHIFDLPTASSTNTGKLSNTDYTTFTNKASKGFAVAMAAAL